MFCLSNVHFLPVKHARLERKTVRKKVCAERLLANSNMNFGQPFTRVYLIFKSPTMGFRETSPYYYYFIVGMNVLPFKGRWTQGRN